MLAGKTLRNLFHTFERQHKQLDIENASQSVREYLAIICSLNKFNWDLELMSTYYKLMDSHEFNTQESNQLQRLIKKEYESKPNILLSDHEKIKCLLEYNANGYTGGHHKDALEKSFRQLALNNFEVPEFKVL